jgi:multicomponent K+:H+ antiporter subunit F
MIINAVLPWVALAFGVALLLAAWRLLRGPTLPDRLLALDAMYANALALLVVLGLQWRTLLFFEAALVVAMLGFVCTVVLSKFFLRGDIVE